MGSSIGQVLLLYSVFSLYCIDFTIVSTVVSSLFVNWWCVYLCALVFDFGHFDFLEYPDTSKIYMYIYYLCCFSHPKYILIIYLV